MSKFGEEWKWNSIATLNTAHPVDAYFYLFTNSQYSIAIKNEDYQLKD